MAMPSSLLTLQDACAAIAARVAPVGVEPVDVESAAGRIAAEPVTAAESLPGFDNSAMDGYAVRAVDTVDAPVTLPVRGEARAGRPADAPLGAGDAMRIATGAPLPAGADAIVRREAAEEGEGGAIYLRAAVRPGCDVRREGEEVRAGDVLLEPGTRLGPVELGALAAAGVRRLVCRRRPRVAIVGTGDELTGTGRPLAPGGVRDSNRLTLQSLVEARGGEVVFSQAAPDDPGRITAAIVAALGAADLLFTCGGMSVGAHDHVRPALAAAGVELVFAGVALAPGRPAAFGLDGQGRPVLGLPGNPLSSLVAFRLLAEPALDGLAGRRPQARSVTLPAAQPFERRPWSVHAVPCRIGSGGASPLGVTGHGPIAALGADGLALVPPGEGTVARGAPVEVALL